MLPGYQDSFSEENLGTISSIPPHVLFPPDVVRGYTRVSGSVFDDSPNVFFMDVEQAGDIVDFWNLRAMGKSVLRSRGHGTTQLQVSSIGYRETFMDSFVLITKIYGQAFGEFRFFITTGFC